MAERTPHPNPLPIAEREQMRGQRPEASKGRVPAGLYCDPFGKPRCLNLRHMVTCTRYGKDGRARALHVAESGETLKCEECLKDSHGPSRSVLRPSSGTGKDRG